MKLEDEDLTDLATSSAAMVQHLAERWRTRMQSGDLHGRAPAQCLELIARLDRAAAVLAHGDESTGVAPAESSTQRTERALTVSEERFRLLVDTVRDYAIFMLDPDGRIASWNAGAERIKGYRADEIVGQHFSRFYTPEDIARGHPEDELRIATRDGRYAEEGWRLRKDGTRFWASVTITALRDASGTLRGFAKVTRDLTERKLAEEALRHREEQLAITLHSIGDAVIATDSQGVVTLVNPVAEQLTGWAHDDALGRPLTDVFNIVNEHTRAPADNPVARVLRDGIVVGLANHTSLIARDGSERPIADSAAPIRDARGATAGVVMIFRDQTNERAAENELRESEERFRLLVDSVRDYAIFMLDPDGRVASWNQGAEHIKGYRADEIMGEHFSRFYPPEDVLAGKPEDEIRVATAEGRFEDEGWRLRKDGSRFWANVVLTVVRDASGKLRGFAKVTRDLTDRKRGEDERVALAQAQEAVRLRDEFLSVAAHELRTPLTALQLQLDGLARATRATAGADEASTRLADRAEKARRYAVRLAGLVDALLDLSRMTARRLDIAPESLDFTALVRETLDNLRSEAERAGCALRMESTAPVRGVWDPIRLEQVVTNLLANAIKFGRGHPIDVALTADGTRALLTVRDGGVGIAPEDLERIFGRFERGVSARHYGGLGLGLFLTRLYVEAHGGTIRVVSSPGAGATFEVALPLTQPDAALLAPGGAAS